MDEQREEVKWCVGGIDDWIRILWMENVFLLFAAAAPSLIKLGPDNIVNNIGRVCTVDVVHTYRQGDDYAQDTLAGWLAGWLRAMMRYVDE